ncbi:unnamed protein product, partial [Polarella glacialis]
RWAVALGLLASARDFSVEPDLRSFAAALGACRRSGKAWASSLALFQLQRLRQLGLDPNLVIVNAVISSCAGSSAWPQSLDLLGRLKVLNPGGVLLPDVITFSTSMTSCTQGQQWEAALQLFAEMGRQEVRPDIVACGSCIAACDVG